MDNEFDKNGFLMFNSDGSKAYKLVELQGVHCGICGKFDQYMEPDGYCNSCRKEKYDNSKCWECDEKFTGQAGWYVPSFQTYNDVNYYCPECIIEKKKRAEKMEKSEGLAPGNYWYPIANSERNDDERR